MSPESIPGHIGWRQMLSSLSQHCSSYCSYRLSQNHHFVLCWWTNMTCHPYNYFLGCSLLFNRETVEDPLKVFRNSSSLRLKEHHNLKVEGCRATRTYYWTDQSTQPWKQLQTAGRQTFFISRKNRQAQFLEVCL